MTKQYSLLQLSEVVNARIVGNEKIMISGFNGLKQAQPGDISLLYTDHYLVDLKTTAASAIVCSERYQNEIKNGLVLDNPRRAFIAIMELFVELPARSKTVSQDAIIDKSSQIGENCLIDPRVSIGADSIIGNNVQLHNGVVVGRGCHIGDNCIIYPNVVIYDQCQLGQDVIIHANTTIGSDGFGFATEGDQHHKIPHYKSVIIHDQVEIGSNCAIDRGSLIDTIIGQGTKIDNLVHIAHNVEVGKYNIICANSSIAGSSKTGLKVIMGGVSSIADGLSVGDNCMIGGYGVVTRNLAANSVVYGYPARDKKKWTKTLAYQNMLPQLLSRIKDLENQLQQLKK